MSSDRADRIFRGTFPAPPHLHCHAHRHSNVTVFTKLQQSGSCCWLAASQIPRPFIDDPVGALLAFDASYQLGARVVCVSAHSFRVFVFGGLTAPSLRAATGERRDSSIDTYLHTSSLLCHLSSSASPISLRATIKPPLVWCPPTTKHLSTTLPTTQAKSHQTSQSVADTLLHTWGAFCQSHHDTTALRLQRPYPTGKT